MIIEHVVAIKMICIVSTRYLKQTKKTNINYKLTKKYSDSFYNTEYYYSVLNYNNDDIQS